MTVLLSAVQSKIAPSSPSSKVKRLELTRRVPPASRSATSPVPRTDDSRNATRLLSTVALELFIHDPTKFVSRFGLSMSLPVSASSRIVQKLHGVSGRISAELQRSE